MNSSLLVLIIVVIVLYLIFGRSSKSKSNNQQTSSSSQQVVKKKKKGYGRWVGAGLGFIFGGGVIGGIIGYVIGNVFSGWTEDDISRNMGDTAPKRDFNVSLLVLSAAIMKADGKLLKSELDYVKRFFLKNFGQERAENYIKLLREILVQDYDLHEVGQQIGGVMDYSSRLELLHYLFGLADADGSISPEELNVLRKISIYLTIASPDFESIKAMFVQSANVTDDAYKILEIDPNATDDEVKKAYREMAKKYHPDLVSHLGEEVRQSAERKLQEVNAAYEKIKKQRGIS